MTRGIPILLAALALGLAGCGGGGDGDGSGTQTQAAAEVPGDPQRGEQVFADAGCGGCHTLEAAGSGGSVGPNLDELQPELETIAEQVRAGGGGMPAFGDRLSDGQIEDVAAFVYSSTR